MHNQIEVEIQDLLLSETEETFIADTLIRRWSSIAYNDDNSHAIAQFLIQCRFYASLCDQMAQRLLKYQELPWQDTVYILKKFDSYIDQEVIDLFFCGLEEIRQLQLLPFMIYEESFLDVHLENDWKGPLKKIQTHLTELWGDISRKKIPLGATMSQVFQTKTLRAGLNTYNDETNREDVQVTDMETLNIQNTQMNTQVITQTKEVTKTKNEMEFEKIEEMNVGKMKKIDQDRTQIGLGPRLKEELLIHRIFQQVEKEFQIMLEKAKKEILPSFLIQAKIQPWYAYDLAVSLFMMGVYKEALQSLEQYEKHLVSLNSPKKRSNNISSDSLRLEIYSTHKCYLELLEHVDKMFEKYINEDPDIILSLLYFKAEAFWGLNKNHEAIALMSDIVEQKPQFRCADLILSKWKELINN